MQTISTITDGRMAMTAFLITPGSGLPDQLLSKVQTFMAMPSPVDQMVNVSEQIYACKAQLSNEARELCGALAAFCADNAWHGMDVDNRGYLIKKAMQRDAGEIAPPSGWPAEADDPEVKEQYVLMVPAITPTASATGATASSGS